VSTINQENDMPFKHSDLPVIHRCPFCFTLYVPTHASKALAFATEDRDSREQHLSGCCGGECWDRTFDVNPEPKKEWVSPLKMWPIL
jgi:hypothetical protein